MNMHHVEVPSNGSEITRRLIERKKPRIGAQSLVLGKFLRRAMIVLPWSYVLILVLVWVLLQFLGDRWWFATMMLFSPRWIYPLPLLALIPICLLWDRRRWPVLLLSVLILWFPLMDFRLPSGRLFVPAGTNYRVLSCNLHDDECNPDALKALISRENPDFIALQECNYERVRSLLADYQVLYSDRLLVASRFPLREIGSLSGPEPPHTYPRKYAAFYVADTPAGTLTFGCVHFSSPRYGLATVLDRNTGVQPSKKEILEKNILFRQKESAAVKAFLDKISTPILLAGDFNTPVESVIYHDNWTSYHNAFSTTGFGFGRSFECRFRGIPFGVRIDHILGGPQVTPARCWIGSSVGSEHLPVIADIIFE
jgi:vancomycin resistance protein VanJ